MMRCFALAAGLTILVAPFPVPGANAQEASIVTLIPKGGVDLARVRDDFAKAESSKSNMIFDFSSKAGTELPAVPVPLFVPDEVLNDLASDTSKGSEGVVDGSQGSCGKGGVIIPSNDGYSTSCDLGTYDLLVEGTSKMFGTAGSKIANRDDYMDDFSESEAGGSIAFGYANAHYIAFFDCKDGRGQCLTAKAAQAVVDRLVLCSTTGRCMEGGTSQIRR